MQLNRQTQLNFIIEKNNRWRKDFSGCFSFIHLILDICMKILSKYEKLFTFCHSFSLYVFYN